MNTTPVKMKEIAWKDNHGGHGSFTPGEYDEIENEYTNCPTHGLTPSVGHPEDCEKCLVEHMEKTHAGYHAHA